MAELFLELIYEQYKQDVYAYLLSLTRDKPLSEDLTSEVFLAALRALPRFRGDCRIKTWLFSIARHKWYEHLRKSKKDEARESLLELTWADAASLESTVGRRELAERIRALLARMPEKSRAVVWLRIEGYSYAEIAQKQGISESSARVLEFRTKQKLRQILMEEGYADD